MRVFISYSHLDKKFADTISSTLRSKGHEVRYDFSEIREGDNLISKINEELQAADALIVIISENSLSSRFVMHEFSAFALGDISSNKSRIIPVLIDKSAVPQYLARYAYVDLTADLDLGLQKILQGLSEETDVDIQTTLKKKGTYDKAISALSQALQSGRLTLVCGAGVSIGAGIPSWNKLLLRLLESMMNKISNARAISLNDANPDEFQRRYRPSSLVLGKYLKSNLGNDFLPELRNALYDGNPTTCETIEAIIELARPQRDGKPLDSIITFNFDELIEENLEKSNIRFKPVYAEGMRNDPKELPIYHVHGYLPRTGAIPDNTDIVFSEDAYHNQFIDSFSWSNMIQLNKLSQNTCFFIGLSLADPNLRRLMDVSNRKNPSKNLNHYIIKKVPNFSNHNDTIDKLDFLLEEQDANELGLNVIWVNEFSEITGLLKKIVQSER